jgi:hypothetical protein
MSQILKHLGDSLRRTYGTVVGRPMPWKMIDKLATLEEKCEGIEGLDEGDGRSGGKPESNAGGSLRHRSQDGGT